MKIVSTLSFAVSLLSSEQCAIRLTSHCGIEGNEIVDQLAKETIDHDINPPASNHYADLKPLDNSYTCISSMSNKPVSNQLAVHDIT